MAHTDTADGEVHLLASSRFQRYRSKVYAFTFIAFANSHLTRSESVYTPLNVFGLL